MVFIKNNNNFAAILASLKDSDKNREIEDDNFYLWLDNECVLDFACNLLTQNAIECNLHNNSFSVQPTRFTNFSLHEEC